MNGSQPSRYIQTPKLWHSRDPSLPPGSARLLLPLGSSHFTQLPSPAPPHLHASPAPHCPSPHLVPWLCLLGLWSTFGTAPARLTQCPLSPGLGNSSKLLSVSAWMPHSAPDLVSKGKGTHIRSCIVHSSQRVEAAQCLLTNEEAKCDVRTTDYSAFKGRGF